CNLFFQAEDGIRVFHVTGVQTCALPIYKACALLCGRIRNKIYHRLIVLGVHVSTGGKTSKVGQIARRCTVGLKHEIRLTSNRPRSEERRVGKVYRSRRLLWREGKKLNGR